MFLLMKDRGGLQKASSGVVKICDETEKCFQQIFKSAGGNLPRAKLIASVISSAVLNNLSDIILFPTFHNHMFDTDVNNNHVHQLVKIVSAACSKIGL